MTEELFGKPLELEPGKVYVIEPAMFLSERAERGIQERLSECAKAIGVTFVMLPFGVRVARETSDVQAA